MTRFLTVLAFAAVAGAMFVAAAPGSQLAAGPTAKQFAALKKQVSTLQTELKGIKAKANDADSFVEGCLVPAGVAPVNQFGTSVTGFWFGPSDNSNTVTRSALDIDLSTPFSGVYLQGVDPSCLSNGASRHARVHTVGSHLPMLAEHRP